MTLAFNLTYANVPFFPDTAKIVRLSRDREVTDPPATQLPPRTQQPETELLDELDRLIPWHWLNDQLPPSAYPGRNLGAVAHRWQPGNSYRSQITPKIGEWFYPNGASRWSVFRGLMTSSQVKSVLQSLSPTPTFPWAPAQFVMQSQPTAPNPNGFTANSYLLQSNMYWLTQRPLAEHGGKFNGLFLVTLVDERYYWQFNQVLLPDQLGGNSTWSSLLTTIQNQLGTTINIGAGIPNVYGKPELDSQLWANYENTGLLLDAIAFNLGAVLVRNLNGTYTLQQPSSAKSVVLTNRPSSSSTVRCAGGDLFSQDTNLPAGNLRPSANAAVPSTLMVTFPYYVLGDDPVPHFLNTRTTPQRGSVWYEESYGEVYSVVVPITSGGTAVAGLNGVPGYTQVVHSTAKALISGEVHVASNNLVAPYVPTNPPLNNSGLTSLAMQIASDYYDTQLQAALDEVYPGTYAWQPEAIHDILWTYSAKRRLASTRVMRSPWNQYPREMQHATPPVASGDTTDVIPIYGSGGTTANPRGVGGPSVAQTWKDHYLVKSGGIYSGGSIITFLADGITSGQAQITVSGISYLPTQNRWRALIDSEIMLLEGTSGGIPAGGAGGVSGNSVASGALDVTVVYRGIDGTIQTDHASGVPVAMLIPNVSYGVNLVRPEKSQFIYPGAWTSGGIQEAVIVPQVQSVYIFSASGQFIDGQVFYSGQVGLFDTTQVSGGIPFQSGEYVWVYERNQAAVTSGGYYEGQLVGYSAEVASGAFVASGNFISAAGVVPAPVYLINQGGAGGGGGGGTFSLTVRNTSGNTYTQSGIHSLTFAPSKLWKLSDISASTPSVSGDVMIETAGFSGTQQVVTSVTCNNNTLVVNSVTNYYQNGLLLSGG